MNSTQNHHDRRTHRGSTFRTVGGGAYDTGYVRTHPQNISGVPIIIGDKDTTGIKKRTQEPLWKLVGNEQY